MTVSRERLLRLTISPRGDRHREVDDARASRTILTFALVASFGLLLVTIADALSRSGHAGAEPVFWLGLLTILLPITWRVASADATRGEHVALVLIVTLALYGLKVAHDPFGFAFGDELVHQHNANEILRSGQLFGQNSILPVTPLYPGLESVTAAVASLSGLSTFGAGLLVIGVARVIAALGIFLLVEQVLKSGRAAALAALLYTATPSYLFFSAQFSYESLSLPLALVALAAVAKASTSEDDLTARRWTALAVALAPAIVMTHHLTSYAILIAFVAIVGFTFLWRRVRVAHGDDAPPVAAWFRHRLQSMSALPHALRVPGPVTRRGGRWVVVCPECAQRQGARKPVTYRSREAAWEAAQEHLLTVHEQHLFEPSAARLAPRGRQAAPARAPTVDAGHAWTHRALWVPSVAMVVAIGVWLTIAGRQTEQYLSPVLTRAIGQTFGVLSQEAPPRALFQASVGNGTIGATPAWERVVAIASVLILLAWIPVGLRAAWRHVWGAPVLTLLVAAAIAYLGTFPLRFVPAAWETASRASEFLFVGVATVLATTASPYGFRWLARRGRALLVCGGLAILVSGGLIAGWPPTLRLSLPYRVAVDGTSIDPQGVSLGRWSRGALGRGNGIAAEASDARLLQLYGEQRAVAGVFPDVQDVLHQGRLEPWMAQLLHDQDLNDVAVDRRALSADAALGYFFAPVGSSRAKELDPVVISKFDGRTDVDRIFDSGDLVVYDVRDLSD